MKSLNEWLQCCSPSAHVVTRLGRAALLVGSLSLGACADDTITGVEQSELVRAEQRWKASGMEGAKYVMQQQRLCFCPDYMITWEVTVSAGVPTRVVSPTGLELPPTYVATFRSVEQMFAEIRAGTDKGVVKEVAYDAARGYPAVLSIDPLQSIADDEVVYRTSNVVRIP